MTILLALVHLIFPAYFNWTKDLKPLSLINRQMMYIHTFFIALALLLTGLLCVTAATDLVQTGLGRKMCLGFGIFWTIRLLIQFFGYSSVLWKGKLFETTVHILFTVVWAYFSTVFLGIYFY